MNWLEFALRHVGEPITVRVEAPGREPVPIGPCVVARHDHGTTLLCPPDVVAPPGTRITLPAGDTVEVVATVHLDAHGTRLPAHQQLDVRISADPGAVRRGPCRPSGRLR
ncbi:hypothetical protein [Actinoplanes derwentensis]|uniref:Uncharacterized protein n=1 Tax=Actinoplanes derwentensis TaxID=113562 RepID=A0A1H2DEG3_9ACTN|nr:hypothetical protein [Actinoplanes derwentensis]GID84769.1 hypothetical protein Ade03nite_36930 [Actinoplanes derwentensis]SDT81138.1 hypothetical protein SAMN04489716_9510 [Actinoplanes derwentensis]